MTRISFFNKIPLILWGIFLLAGPAAADTIVLKGGIIHPMIGDIIPSGVIIIEGNKIIDVGRDLPIPEGADVISLEDCHFYPGFILTSDILADKEIKNYESLAPDFKAADRFDPASDYSFFTARGFTSGLIGAGDFRLISGQIAAAKLIGRKGNPYLLHDAAGLSINLLEKALSPPPVYIFPAPVSPKNPITPPTRQFPSTLWGGFMTVKTLFELEASFTGDLAKYYTHLIDSLQECREKKMPLIIQCENVSYALQSAALAESLDMPVIFRDPPLDPEIIPILRNSGASAIVDLSRLSGLTSSLKAPADAPFKTEEIEFLSSLLKSGIPTAFTFQKKVLETWDPASLASFFLRFGIDMEALFQTLTANPAQMLGMEKRIGALRGGADADILVFKESPSRQTLELVRIMSEGKWIHE